MLMDDISLQKIHLAKVTVNGDIPPRLKSAHESSSTSSDPDLNPVPQPETETVPHGAFHERILEEILEERAAACSPEEIRRED